MVEKENSIDRGYRLIHNWTRVIEDLRVDEIDCHRYIKEIDDKIEALHKERLIYEKRLEETKNDKRDALYTKFALEHFIKLSSELDFYVD